MQRLFVAEFTADIFECAYAPPAFQNVTISAQSASLGAPITPGVTKRYQVQYRKLSASFCPLASGGWNTTNAVAVTW
jgi:hypothetical protein